MATIGDILKARFGTDEYLEVVFDGRQSLLPARDGQSSLHEIAQSKPPKAKRRMVYSEAGREAQGWKRAKA